MRDSDSEPAEENLLHHLSAVPILAFSDCQRVLLRPSPSIFTFVLVSRKTERILNTELIFFCHDTLYDVSHVYIQ